MNAREFLVKSLSEISVAIPKINLKYAYDEISDFHIVEVYPESIRRGNTEYMEMECELWKNFQRLFPDEDLLVSEMDETNDMTNVIYEKTSSSLN